MALRGARLTGLWAVLALGLVACGGRATAPNDAGVEDGTLTDASRSDRSDLRCAPFWNTCLPNEVCNVQGCATDAGGRCVPQEASCPSIYSPVCGCDWVTYANDCERLAAGEALNHTGACATYDGGGSCIDSDLEPNDSPPTATNLDGSLAGHPQGVSLYGVEICWAGDLDYYSFTLASPKTATLLVLYTPSQGALSASMLDAGLNTVATGTANGNGLEAQATLAAGLYYIRFAAGPAGSINKYDFSITFQ